jgi:chromate transporter
MWLDITTFNNGIALCQMIPGASAMQTAAYVGFKLRGVAGAAACFAGFGLPAFVIMMIFSIIYSETYTIEKVISAFKGLHVIIISIIANAVISFGKNSIKTLGNFLIAITAATLFFFGLHPVVVIVISALLGIMLVNHKTETQAQLEPGEKINPIKIIIASIVSIIIYFILLYHININLFNLSLLMFRIDLFAFGGGFSSIPLIYHEVVEKYAWLQRETLLNGIALGQITPGPIVITATFIGYMMEGVAGAIIATISIFTPSFLMVIGIEPYFHKLKSFKHFSTAIEGVLCCFVGLLLSVTVSFALNISWDYRLIIISALSFIALLLKVNIAWIVLAGIIFSIIIF